MRVKPSVILTLLILTASMILSGCGASAPDEPVSEPFTEPASAEPVSAETDPFAGSDSLPEDLLLPENIRGVSGTAIGTIVLPAAAADDLCLSFAASDLQYHFEKVTGAVLPIVSRPGEGYGSLILATPDSLPAVSDLFADDIAWLADLGSKETGRWGSDGFAIRQLGDDIWIIGNTSKGAMNGVYDLIEENLGVIWTRADESKGLFFDPMDEAVLRKVDYREKSPFAERGWTFASDDANKLLFARNKINGGQKNEQFGQVQLLYPHNIKSFLRSSPLYDPEETEYWETDEAGNSLGDSGSHQVNPWSDKAAECIAATVIAQMKETGERFVFIGEEDAAAPQRCVPYDTLPFEYAPGLFVNPSDSNYYSTVFHSMINKIARLVREEIEDGVIGTFAYSIALEPPACEMEDNVQICIAPIAEDMTMPLLDTSARDRLNQSPSNLYCDFIPEWYEKAELVFYWHYYTCNPYGTQYSWPIYHKLQEDLREHAEHGVYGVMTGGFADMDFRNGWLEYYGLDATCSNYWDMNVLMLWLYQKLVWNPYEDVPALIVTFCDKVYGEASPYMQEYYRLMEQGFAAGAQTTRRPTVISTIASDFYQVFVRKQQIGHDVLDALDQARQAASGPIRDTIEYMYENVRSVLSSFRNY